MYVVLGSALIHFLSSLPPRKHLPIYSSRPDFGVLVYPVITMEEGVTHAGSKINLFGPDLTASMTQFLTQKYSIEKHVDHTFPPTFIFAAKDDEGVPVENSYLLDRALKAAKVICSL